MQLLLKFIYCFAESLGVEISTRNINEFETLVCYRTIVTDLGAADSAGPIVKSVSG